MPDQHYCPKTIIPLTFSLFTINRNFKTCIVSIPSMPSISDFCYNFIIAFQPLQSMKCLSNSRALSLCHGCSFVNFFSIHRQENGRSSIPPGRAGKQDILVVKTKPQLLLSGAWEEQALSDVMSEKNGKTQVRKMISFFHSLCYNKRIPIEWRYAGGSQTIIDRCVYVRG